MQMMFHIFDLRTGERILCMKRQSRYRTTIKMRKTGNEFQHLKSEEEYLNENTDLLDALKAGKTIYC
jgi:hypothetical protein